MATNRPKYENPVRQYFQQPKPAYVHSVYELVAAAIIWSIVIAGLVVLLGCSTARAGDHADACDLASTTRDMAECFGAVAKRTEKVLQSKFEQRLQRTPAYLRKALVEAQKGWIVLRDKECDRGWEGSITPVEFAICIAEENRKRTTLIEKGGAR